MDLVKYRYIVFPSVEKLKEWANNPPQDEDPKKRKEICSGLLFESLGNQQYSYTIFSDKRKNSQTGQYIFDPYAWYEFLL